MDRAGSVVHHRLNLTSFMEQCMDYAAEIKKYTNEINSGALAAIEKFLSIAMRNPDSALVSTSDPKELATVRDGFASRKLGLAPDAAEAGLKAVAEKMKGEPRKNRVVFYYLLAEATGTLDKLA
jgi:hypothetical protein